MFHSALKSKQSAQHLSLCTLNLQAESDGSWWWYAVIGLIDILDIVDFSIHIISGASIFP
jgi:hypothetical protein